MLTVINYADDRFRLARDYNTETAYQYGGADKVIEYSPDTLPMDIKKKYPQWFIQNDPVIGRYCIWRPYIVLDALDNCQDGDYICYCDAGAYFIRSITLLIEVMNQNNDEIMLFGLPFLEKEWTKRDVFIYFNADEPVYTNTPQIMSTIFLIKKSTKSVEFFEEFKKVSQIAPELFTDLDNSMGKENYPEFLAHRHNQSILSILAKKHNLNIYRDPSEYGVRPTLYKYSAPNATFMNIKYKNSPYPQVIVHHRSKEIRMDVKLFALIRKIFPPLFAVRLFNLGHKIKYMFSEKKYG